MRHLHNDIPLKEASLLSLAVEEHASSDDDDDDDDDDEYVMFGLDFTSGDFQGVVDFGNNNNEEEEIRKQQQQRDLMMLRQRQQVDNLLRLEDASKDEPATDSDFDRLFAWATKRGAILDAITCGRDEYGGRGLFCTRSVPKGGILAVLPRDMRIGQKLACQRIPCLPVDTPDLSALSLLVLSFLNDNNNIKDKNNRNTNGDDEDDHDDWGIYARTLPRCGEFTNAIGMSDSELEAWRMRGPEYEKALLHVQRKAEACATYIHTCLSSSSSQYEEEGGEEKKSDDVITTTKEEDDDVNNKGTVFWAIAMVMSRSHGFASTTGRWMTPVLDLANHCPREQGGGKLECDDRGRLILRAGKALACGDEVTLDYQVDDDAELVATYGFSLSLAN